MRTPMNIFRHTPVTLLLAACFLSGLGCDHGGEKVVTVTGRVTHNDKPIAGLTVSFVPQATTNTGVSTGITDEDGKYKLTVSSTGSTGAVVGTHKVWVSLPRQPEESDQEEKKKIKRNPAANVPTDMAKILQKYGNLTKTPLTVEVTGDEPLDLKLD
jgi:hypothetical protein